MAENNVKGFAIVRGRVTATKPMNRSVNGNPRYAVTITDKNGYDWNTSTAVDSMLAFGITNAEYRDNEHSFYIDRNGCIGTTAGKD
jgi:hypothetical protein